MNDARRYKKEAINFLKENKIQDFFELFFNVYTIIEETEMELETFTDGGVNVIIQLSKNDPIGDFKEYVNEFNVDDEIDLHRTNKEYRDLFTIRKSLVDFEDFHKWLKDIVGIIKETES